ncbi:MAG: YbaB/EbfC family nucleoid-associated protein [Alphaproteobacteria bacterium]|jgi:DNA-binding YbaB/EbfC family protein|nr:YbaB/EbfC family nucleoid-associated protein [Alphaproteobacteria bacterium]
MKDLGALMKQAQAMQQKLQEAQARLQAADYSGGAGGDMVRVTLTGTGALKAVHIDPELMAPGEAEILADLLIAAHADARRKLEAAQGEMMREAAGPLAGLPGLGI